MKLNARKIAEAEAWVEKNGLHPQPCGATIKMFCTQMGISFMTYQRWCENENFVNALNRAREIFHSTTVRDVENALVKAARGVDFVHIKEEKKAQKVKEYDEKGRKIKEYDGDPIIVKSMRETIYYPPDVKAAQFVLTNMEPERWKNKQEHTISPDSQPLVLQLSERAKEGLEKALSTGAMPRKPKDEE